MQVVILAAGKGDRFVNAGYTTIKPLIPALGKPMISYALSQAAVITQQPIVLCPESVVFDIWRCTPPELDVVPSTVAVRYTQAGAAMTLLTAGSKLNEREPVMVMDCDSIIEHTAMKEFASWATESFANGFHSSLMAFRSHDSSSRYSFVRMAQHHQTRFPTVVEVVEKVRISDVATCGVHAFSSWALLREAICEMTCKRHRISNEYYVAPVHNYLPNTSMYMTRDGAFTAIGTPEQLEAYERSVPSAE